MQGHAFVWGDNDDGFLWGVLIPNSKFRMLSTDIVELSDGTSIKVGSSDLTISQRASKTRLNLREKRVFVFNSHSDVTHFDNIDGIKCKHETSFSRWFNMNTTVRQMVLPDDFLGQLGLEPKPEEKL